MMNRLPLSDEQIEHIRLYLSGQASSELQEEVESQMAHSTDFAASVEEFRFLMEGLKSIHARDMRAKLAEWEADRKKAEHSQKESEETSGGKVIGFTPWMSYAAVAAVALLLIVSVGRWNDWFGSSPKGYDQLLAENLTDVPMPSLLRGGNAPSDSLSIWYRTGISYYSMEQYQEAIYYLEKCVEQDSLPDDIRIGSLDLFLGVSYLQAQQTELAEKSFDKIPDTGLYKIQKEWFLALTHLQAHDTVLLKQELTRISSQVKHPYQQKATNLLEQLPQ
ncbi:MAG: tetratricopeptide repeat protein [Bacteroidota bacterium]